MAKKDFIIIVDVETTQDNLVADFAAVIVDRKGNIYNQCAVLIDGIFTDYKNHPLFFDSSMPSDSIWSRQGQDKRYAKYNAMVKSGARMIASINAVNRWLAHAMGKYNPILTAYNLPFDLSKCDNTQIDLTLFNHSFCLWSAAYTKWAHTKKYKNFILNTHGFNNPTALGNMTYKTNAEIMTRFLLNNPLLDNEPHTALEDIIFYELIIFKMLAKNTPKKNWLESEPYNWRNVQVKNHFTAV